MITRRAFGKLVTAALIAPKSSFAREPIPADLDHIILGCSDLEAGIQFVKERTGVRAAFGGVHPGRGTRNALLSLGLMRYLEIMAPDPEQPNTEPPVERLKNLRRLSSPQIVAWVVHTNHIDKIAGRLKGQGISFQPIFSGSRKRSDGRMLNWKMLTLADDREGLFPFFIQWSPDSPHPSLDAPAGCQLQRLFATAPNPAGLAGEFQRIGVVLGVQSGDRPQLRADITAQSGTLQLSS
jgi:catechol 2,3-dioxygenase-like lactoylglutathione lyase family enzyme